MKNSTTLLIAAIVVGAAGGYLTGKNTASSQSDAGGDERVAVRTRTAERVERMRQGGNVVRGSQPSKGYNDIVRMAGSSNRIQAMIDFYEGLSLEQLEQEAKKLDDLPMNERMMASLLLFGRWGEVDARSAMEYANTMGFAGMFVRPTVLQSWASVDPVNAANYYVKNPREFSSMAGGRRGFMGRQGGAEIIASEWAKQDPQSAMAWASTLTSEKDRALAGVVGEVAKLDPAQAAQMLNGVEAADAGRAYRTVAEYYGTTNFAEAQSWIRSLPADEQEGAMASAISGLAKTDARAAAAQVAMMADGGSKDRAVENVVGVMAREDPRTAAEFMVQNGSADAQEDSMRSLIPNWVAKDATAALDFVGGLPEGGVRDRGLRSYVWSNRNAAPSELVRVAETISDDRNRNRTVGMMVGRWMNEDEAAARAYVQQSTAMSARMKEHILGDGSDR